MKPNPHQQFQQQVQQQQQQRQRQMAGYAWQQQQELLAMSETVPRQRGGCARVFSAVWTFVLSLIVLGIVCGATGYIAGGVLGESDDTAVLGAMVGGLIAFIGAGISAIRAASK